MPSSAQKVLRLGASGRTFGNCKDTRTNEHTRIHTLTQIPLIKSPNNASVAAGCDIVLNPSAPGVLLWGIAQSLTQPHPLHLRQRTQKICWDKGLHTRRARVTNVFNSDGNEAECSKTIWVKASKTWCTAYTLFTICARTQSHLSKFRHVY